MIKSTLQSLILDNFPHQPTSQQADVARQWAEFLTSEGEREAFLLTGYAGTGKTSLLAALVRAMHQLQLPVVLLAPTGRAAKVFSLYSSSPAFTIHRKIYRQREFSPEMKGFYPSFNKSKNTLFIVDESSMIGSDTYNSASFGTGDLLHDLVGYVYSASGCRLLLVGDTAQLPPVSQVISPALDMEALHAQCLTVRHAELTEVVRQASESGILWNATALRTLLSEEQFALFPKIKVKGFPDVCPLPGSELIEALEDSYTRVGRDQTIVVTRSNKRANIYNNGIRARILDYEEELVPGDQLIVARNNYYWTERLSDASTPFIANGDIAVVVRSRGERHLHGFRFVDATLRFPDYDEQELTVTLMLDALQAEAPSLTREQGLQLFQSVCADYPDIHNHRKLMEKVRNDPYYNALQVKYAYAVTCHKAQGGQWQHVYIDQGYVTAEMLSPDYFRWLYTAFTRATGKVYLVNWPQGQIL